MDNNPYNPPCDSQSGEYDHRLFWRLVKTAAVMCAVAFLLDGILLCMGNLSSSQADPVEILASQFQHNQFRRNADWWPSTSVLP